MQGANFLTIISARPHCSDSSKTRIYNYKNWMLLHADVFNQPIRGLKVSKASFWLEHHYRWTNLSNWVIVLESNIHWYILPFVIFLVVPHKLLMKYSNCLWAAVAEVCLLVQGPSVFASAGISSESVDLIYRQWVTECILVLDNLFVCESVNTSELHLTTQRIQCIIYSRCQNNLQVFKTKITVNNTSVLGDVGKRDENTISRWLQSHILAKRL